MFVRQAVSIEGFLRKPFVLKGNTSFLREILDSKGKACLTLKGNRLLQWETHYSKGKPLTLKGDSLFQKKPLILKGHLVFSRGAHYSKVKIPYSKGKPFILKGTHAFTLKGNRPPQREIHYSKGKPLSLKGHPLFQKKPPTLKENPLL
jgi:hypothetical protein